MFKTAPKRKLATPRIIDAQTVASLKVWISGEIQKYLSQGHKSFTIKDLFGGSYWNWSQKNMPIQILYYEWYKKYEKDYPGEDHDTLSKWAYDAAGQSVGLLINQCCFEDQSHVYDKVNEFQITRYIVC